MDNTNSLFSQIILPNGTRLKNRIIKSAMSDSLGDGRGNPTKTQMRLYERWAQGGAAASIVGEVQGNPSFAEKPGNLVLNAASDEGLFRAFAHVGASEDAQLWLQLGHAGALTPPSIGTPKGPSELDFPGLQASALSIDEIRALPGQFASTAHRAESLGFNGVQIHAAHGFLLSQFLSPLFNRRTDAYGGDIKNRMRILIEVIEAVRSAVAPSFVVALKLNSSDQLEGGLQPEEALDVIKVLEGRGLDLIDISGGTYFPGAQSSSDRSTSGPYFLDFTATAKESTKVPLMSTGGFKTRSQAEAAIASGAVDLVGIARALVLDPALPMTWQRDGPDPVFPRFENAPPGGVTAWFTMRMTELGEGREGCQNSDAIKALERYDLRDARRTADWNKKFDSKPEGG